MRSFRPLPQTVSAPVSRSKSVSSRETASERRSPAPYKSASLARPKGLPMARLEDLTPGARVKGLRTDGPIEVVKAEWFGGGAVELTFKDIGGQAGNQILYRSDEARMEIVSAGPVAAFDGDGSLFRLVSEAYRIHLGYLFDPLLAPAPDHRRLQGDAGAPAAPLPPRRRSGRRQDDHGRALHQGAGG